MEMEQLLSTPALYIPLIVFLLIAAFTDVKHLKIPNWLNATFLLIRLLLIPFVGIAWSDIGGAAFLFFMVFIIAFITYMQMGGDIKAMVVLGIYLGFSLSVVFLFISIFYLAVAGIVVYIKTKDKRADIPFAPCFLLSLLTIIGVGMFI